MSVLDDIAFFKKCQPAMLKSEGEVEDIKP